MMPIWNILVDRAEFSDSEIDLPGPDPSAIVFDVIGERQLRSRKHADRDIGLALRRKASR
jgi:hypothetical protein